MCNVTTIDKNTLAALIAVAMHASRGDLAPDVLAKRAHRAVADASRNPHRQRSRQDLMADVTYQQASQRRNRPTSAEWQAASLSLAQLFAELSRRDAENAALGLDFTEPNGVEVWLAGILLERRG